MRQRGIDPVIHSLWRGEKTWEGIPIQRFKLIELGKLLFYIPYWTWKKPAEMSHALGVILYSKPPCLTNIGETLLGLAYGLIYARRFKKSHFDLCHAVWATMPASAAWLMHQLTGQRYSMGAHAFDVFRHGGDWLLRAKLQDACLIHTSTIAARRHLIKMGADRKRTVIIRRGLDHFTDCKTALPDADCLRLVSIGRTVPKKGYLRQLAIYRALADAGIPFEARIAGSGSMLKKLEGRQYALGLQDKVHFLGKQNSAAIDQLYAWGDYFLFTGEVAACGDRDGLPNVIPEAMAAGLIVLTTPMAGAMEAIKQDQTGIVLSSHKPRAWVETLEALRKDPQRLLRLRQQARQWVETRFCAHRNARTLAQALERAIR